MRRVKEVRNLYVVESPLQLLCAFEKSFFQENVTFVVRMNGNPANDNQILKVAKTLEIDVIKKVLRPSKIKLDSLKNIIFIIYLLVKFDTYYLGSYHSKLLAFLRRFINAKNIVLLDDGVATLLAQKEMESHKRPYNIFTFFDLKPLPFQKIEKHSFQNLVKIFNIENKSKNGTYFIGQKVVEVGILSLDLYISIVGRAAKMAGADNLIYIPHRGESEVVISRLKSIKGLEVRFIESPIELYFISEKNPPVAIYSIISTALNTLSIISKKTSFFALVPKCLSKTRVPHIENIVQQLEKNSNIDVISI
ncbi:hypothetical protein [Marinobacter salarius]|uniref:hypothetical protein n=1 Tax=Marinobacter salarius TaxID=1420917 RepID=UPI003D9C3706